MMVYYKIGEFAQLSGVTAKTLRFYDEIGLLRPAALDPLTRYRRYHPQQLQELAAIIALKELGLSLQDIHSVAGKAGLKKDRRELLQKLRATVEHSIQAASRSLDLIKIALDELNDSPSPTPVVLKRRPPVPIASVRVGIKNYAEIVQFETDLVSQLPSESVGSLRGVLWHRCADSGSIEGEPFVELKGRVPHRSAYELKELPSATLACAYSGLEDDSAERAYGAVRRWIDARGHRLVGPRREIYLHQMLEIQFPLTSV